MRTHAGAENTTPTIVGDREVGMATCGAIVDTISLVTPDVASCANCTRIEARKKAYRESRQLA